MGDCQDVIEKPMNSSEPRLASCQPRLSISKFPIRSRVVQEAIAVTGESHRNWCIYEAEANLIPAIPRFQG